jgi:ribosomal protein L11 methyltransferase
MGQLLKITISATSNLHELLIAELSGLQFDSFQELDDELDAFIEEEFFDRGLLEEILGKYDVDKAVKVEKIQNINWNEQWEKNFDPVYISRKVQIRATFHKTKPEYQYDVIINPKMSFGTGHHETTHLMISRQLEIDHQKRSVLDVGTGTGILAIMAHKLGAGSITATDVDGWCIENSLENFQLNGLEEFEILHGKIQNLTLAGPYDIMLANINKNVLLDEMHEYRKLLDDRGWLLLSGFYEQDVEDIVEKAGACGLQPVSQHTQNNWSAICLKASPT